MSITSGHLVFALVFFIVFAIVLVFMYRKDLQLHRRYYRRSWIILVFVAIIVAVFLYLKRLFIDL